jgi:hypothetical protein
MAEIGRMDRVCFDNGVKLAETAVGWGHRFKLMDQIAREAEAWITEDKDFI